MSYPSQKTKETETNIKHGYLLFNKNYLWLVPYILAPYQIYSIHKELCSRCDINAAHESVNKGGWTRLSFVNKGGWARLSFVNKIGCIDLTFVFYVYLVCLSN